MESVGNCSIVTVLADGSLKACHAEVLTFGDNAFLKGSESLADGVHLAPYSLVTLDGSLKTELLVDDVLAGILKKSLHVEVSHCGRETFCSGEVYGVHGRCTGGYVGCKLSKKLNVHCVDVKHFVFLLFFCYGRTRVCEFRILCALPFYGNAQPPP